MKRDPYIKKLLWHLITICFVAALHFVGGAAISWADENTGTRSGFPLADLRFGDFDGDGRTDVFTVSGQQWQYSSGGIGPWTNLSASSSPIGALRFGDFDGDGRTDVFTVSGQQWLYSSGGVGSWVNLTTSGSPLADLRFEDFNGDGRTDVFTVSGQQWRYSSGGVGSWTNLATSGYPLADLRFGDFDGDGRTDVFVVSGQQWLYSSGGIGPWTNLSASSSPIGALRFGDFDGDGRTDVFTASGQQWQYSSGGVGSWSTIVALNPQHPLTSSCATDIKLDAFTVITETCEKHQCKVFDENSGNHSYKDTTQEQCIPRVGEWVCTAYKKIEVVPTQTVVSSIAACLEEHIGANKIQHYTDHSNNLKILNGLKAQIISSISSLPDQLLPATATNAIREEIITEVNKLMDEKNEQLREALLLEIEQNAVK